MRIPLYASLLAVCLSAGALAVPPVVNDPLMENGVATVSPRIPTAKALLFPVSAFSTVSEQLTITATSSNPKVLVRVKTGNPLLRFDIQHSGDTTYTDIAVFQLFRDIAPETVAYMAGFAQGGLFDKPETVDSNGAATTGNDRIFRLADFGAVEGQAQHSFIFQGGSPTGTNSGSVGFTFDNEFNPAAIFDGRGQLAMANAGYSSLKKGTNGSQFFITDGNTRSLDFKHTIWGQLTHGWKTLQDLHDTPRQTTATTGTDTGKPDYPRQDQPNSPIRITSASVVPQFVQNDRTYTDAVLVLSATAPGTAQITITATNAAGESAAQTFTATVQDDDLSLNSRPFLTPLPNAVIKPKGQANLPFGVIDLERDYVSQAAALQSNGTTNNPKGYSGILQAGVLAVVGNPSYLGGTGSASAGPYKGPLYPSLNVTQFEMNYRGAVDGAGRAIDNSSASVVSVGDLKDLPEPVVLYGEPGVALPTVTVASGAPPATVVARYRDSDPQGAPADIGAQVNWGDGSAVEVGTISVDSSKPAAAGYQISGNHTYTRAGIYSVVVTLNSILGQVQKIVSTAIITSSPIKALGQMLVLPGPTVANGILATFTDSASAGAPGAYMATVDWGDGKVAPATVRAAGEGKFTVVGKHSYLNAERYSVAVRVHKAGFATTDDAIAWSSVILTKFTGKRHLPPFDQAHLVAALSPVPVDHTKPTGSTKETKSTIGDVTGLSQTYLSYFMIIVNSGNLASKPGKLQFYLSPDNKLNTTDEKDSTGAVVNPKDRIVQIADLEESEFFLPAIPAGGSLQYYFEKSKYADYRLALPPSETGTGSNLLVNLDYSDPIADHEPIERFASAGRIQGILVEPRIVNTRESGTTGTFSVKLDKKPTKNVVVPLSIATAGATEGTINKTSLTFTPENWGTPQVVTVTGKSDTPTTGTTYGRDGSKTYQILVQAATGDDPIFAGMDAPDVTVTNGDRDSNILISSTSLTTSEAAGPFHARSIPIQLQREPTAPVHVTISVSKPAEAEITNGEPDTADPTKRVFTFMPRDPTAKPPIVLTQNFTVQGKNDFTRDGNTTYTINFTVTSEDKEFDGLSLPPLTITSIDDGPLTP